MMLLTRSNIWARKLLHLIGVIDFLISAISPVDDLIQQEFTRSRNQLTASMHACRHCVTAKPARGHTKPIVAVIDVIDRDYAHSLFELLAETPSGACAQ